LTLFIRFNSGTARGHNSVGNSWGHPPSTVLRASSFPLEGRACEPVAPRMSLPSFSGVAPSTGSFDKLRTGQGRQAPFCYAGSKTNLRIPTDPLQDGGDNRHDHYPHVHPRRSPLDPACRHMIPPIRHIYSYRSCHTFFSPLCPFTRETSFETSFAEYGDVTPQTH
jgi:hypothetical protein